MLLHLCMQDILCTGTHTAETHSVFVLLNVHFCLLLKMFESTEEALQSPVWNIKLDGVYFDLFKPEMFIFQKCKSSLNCKKKLTFSWQIKLQV